MYIEQLFKRTIRKFKQKKIELQDTNANLTIHIIRLIISPKL